MEDFKHLRKEIDNIINIIENCFESFKNDCSYAYFVGQRTDERFVYYFYNIEESVVKKISLKPLNFKTLNENYLTFRFIKKDTDKAHKKIDPLKVPLNILMLREKKQKYNFNPFEYDDVIVEKIIPIENIKEHKDKHVDEILKQFIAFEFRKIGFSYEAIIKNFSNFLETNSFSEFILPEYTYIYRNKKIKLKKIKMINI